MYSNGDLVNKEKLIALKKAGLNEVRFDIAARKYDLNAVRSLLPASLIRLQLKFPSFRKIIKSSTERYVHWDITFRRSSMLT